MKLLIDSDDNEYLSNQQHLLESNGIPAYISNRDSNRVIPFGISKAGLWVYMDEQYDEAMALLKDPNYVVQKQIDMAQFRELAEEIEQDRSGFNATMRDLLLGSVLLLTAIFGFIYLFDRFLS